MSIFGREYLASREMVKDQLKRASHLIPNLSSKNWVIVGATRAA